MLRQRQVAERLENTRQEYVSFLYGFEAVGTSHITRKPAEPTDLSTDEAALFKTTDLADVFFRCDLWSSLFLVGWVGTGVRGRGGLFPAQSGLASAVPDTVCVRCVGRPLPHTTICTLCMTACL